MLFRSHPSNMSKWRRRFGGTISLVYSSSFAALRLSTISSIKPYAFASSALMKLSRSVSSAYSLPQTFGILLHSEPEWSISFADSHTHPSHI